MLRLQRIIIPDHTTRLRPIFFTPRRRVGPGLRRLRGAVERVRLDGVHRGREPLPAGAAGHGVAVGVVVFRFVLGREAPREGPRDIARDAAACPWYAP